ncbi:response regulator [Candidatus Dependentiae bacterium]|nr:response regulator [Candidatus Dependentiae bacterium]
MAKILVADDMVVMRSFIKTILIKEGHTIAGEAGDGEEAYEQYKKILPDLVTMDLTMPKLNGIESSEKIINEFPDAKIIIVSALEQKNVILEAFKAGVKNYVLKPIKRDNLIKIVNDTLVSHNPL